MTDMAYEQADWQRLGRAVVARRVELGYNTQVAFAEHLGMTARILGDIEAGKRASYDRSTLARVERGLDWQPGTTEKILGDSGVVAEALRLATRPRPTGTLDGPFADLADEYHHASPADRALIIEQVRRITEWARYRRTAK